MLTGHAGAGTAAAGFERAAVVCDARDSDKSMSGVVQHAFTLQSAYAQPTADVAGPGEPAFTTFHHGCQGTVDYVWHGAGLAVGGVVEMQNKEKLKRFGGLPTKTWSSDHMSLVVDFYFDDSGAAAGAEPMFAEPS